MVAKAAAIPAAVIRSGSRDASARYSSAVIAIEACSGVVGDEMTYGAWMKGMGIGEGRRPPREASCSAPIMSFMPIELGLRADPPSSTATGAELGRGCGAPDICWAIAASAELPRGGELSRSEVMYAVRAADFERITLHHRRRRI